MADGCSCFTGMTGDFYPDEASAKGDSCYVVVYPTNGSVTLHLEYQVCGKFLFAEP